MLDEAEQDDSAGWAIGAADDINADGIDDLLVGAPDADPRAARKRAGE